MNSKLTELINKNTKNKSFLVKRDWAGIPVEMNFTFQIIDIREMYYAGEPKLTVFVEVSYLGGNHPMNVYVDYLMENKLTKKDMAKGLNKLGGLSYGISEEIRSYLKHYGYNYPVTINEFTIKNKEMSNLSEGRKYDNVVRKIVKDITDIVKLQEEGDFLLPEDIDGNPTYQFTNINQDFDVLVNIIHNDEIDNFIIDGGYYSDESNFEFLIIYNPKKYPSFMYEFIGEMNEVVAHEINHLDQDIKGELSEPGGEMSSLEYYLQPDELDSQYKGFKRQSKLMKRPMEVVVRNWFNKYGDMRGLSEDDIEVIIYEILNYNDKQKN